MDVCLGMAGLLGTCERGVSGMQAGEDVSK